MDPAEDIVNLWLQQQDFFVMTGVKAKGGKEIDFLAVNPVNGKKVHAESHVSVFPLGPLRPWAPAKYGKMPIGRRVTHFYNNKFVGTVKEGTGQLLDRCIEEKAKEKLGGEDYERWLVLGVLHQKDPEDQLKKEFEKCGVRVFLFRDVLKKIGFKGAARGVGRTLQLLASQLTDDAKASLLGKNKKGTSEGFRHLTG